MRFLVHGDLIDLRILADGARASLRAHGQVSALFDRALPRLCALLEVPDASVAKSNVFRHVMYCPAVEEHLSKAMVVIRSMFQKCGAVYG